MADDAKGVALATGDIRTCTSDFFYRIRILTSPIPSFRGMTSSRGGKIGNEYMYADIPMSSIQNRRIDGPMLLYYITPLRLHVYTALHNGDFKERI